MKRISLLLFLFSVQLQVFGIEVFTITGIVSDVKGKPLSAATVFIDGSKKMTVTNSLGQFRFSELLPGTYQVVVNMIGYHSVKQTVNVERQSQVLMISLKENQFALKEVVIRSNPYRAGYLQLFIENFLGTTKNAQSCEIQNTDVLNFIDNKKEKVLEATSDDFLIVINDLLGYKIKYLLRKFKYNRMTTVASYDGEMIFEQLNGDEKDQERWKANRITAFKGSFMHYLRSLYESKTREEGFITYQIYANNQPVPVDVQTAVARIDSNFISLEFINPLFIIYDKDRVAEAYKSGAETKLTKAVAEQGSLIKLYLNNAIIDQKGSFVDYKSFYIKGNWGGKRIGDHLPFEYSLTE